MFAVCTGALPEGPFIDCGFPGLYGRKGTTDDAGEFLLEKMPPALYSIYALIEAPGPGNKVAAEATLPLKLREDKDGIELRLKRPASGKGEPESSAEEKALHSLSGKVVDASGAPVSAASVTASMENPPKGLGKSEGWGNLASEPSGRFTFHHLPQGSYKLSVSAEGFLKAQAVAQTGGEPITISLKPHGVVRGRAVMPDGSPVADLIINCETGSKSSLPDGRFEVFTSDERGEVTLCLSARGMVRTERSLTVLPGQGLELGNVRMEPARVLKVQVTELGSSKPVEWATVSVVGAPQQSSSRPRRTAGP